jgi:hypothetical protein
LKTICGKRSRSTRAIVSAEHASALSHHPEANPGLLQIALAVKMGMGHLARTTKSPQAGDGLILQHTHYYATIFSLFCFFITCFDLTTFSHCGRGQYPR